MNNKKLGTAFEREFLRYLGENGWWAHFLTPNASGAQPFDIIAIRGHYVYALDCKTCNEKRFSFGRIEQNQWFAFDKLLWNTDVQCAIVCKYNDDMYYVPYWLIRRYMELKKTSIELTEGMKTDAGNRFKCYTD